MLIDVQPFKTTGYFPPVELLPWLTHQQSLTEKLKKTVGEARLEVLNQALELSTWWDQWVLGLHPSEPVVHRDIVMWAYDRPCWYARTIIPQNTYEANHHFFSRLQQESLGVLLFNTASVKRHQLFYYPIFPLSIEYQWCSDYLVESSEPLWVRLSVFALEELLPFYLVEILLPGLMDSLKKMPLREIFN